LVLAHQQLPGPMQHQGSLLLLRLDRDEPHRWPRDARIFRSRHCPATAPCIGSRPLRQARGLTHETLAEQVPGHLDYGVDWSARLAGDTIASSTRIRDFLNEAGKLPQRRV
jgi:hypothetical protein